MVPSLSIGVKETERNEPGELEGASPEKEEASCGSIHGSPSSEGRLPGTCLELWAPANLKRALYWAVQPPSTQSMLPVV